MTDRAAVRWLVVVQALFPLAAAIENQFFVHRSADVPPPELPSFGPPWLLGVIGLVAAVTWFFALVSLFNFRPGAGRFYLVLTAICLVPMPFLPPTYASWFSDWATSIGTLAAGMTIAWILLGRVPEQARA